MNDALSSWPGLVVRHPLVQRTADALRDAAVDLALDDHRVDQAAAVVDDGVLEDRDLGGVRVGLDDRRRACRRRTSSARGSRSPCPPGPARRPRPPAACRGRRRRTGWPPWTPRRRRSAAGWTAPRRCPGRSTRPVRPSPRRRRPRSRGRPRPPPAPRRRSGAPSPAPACGQVDRRPAHHRGARGEGADGVRHPAGVAGDHLDVLERHAELVGDELGERRWRAPGPGWSARWRP